MWAPASCAWATKPPRQRRVELVAACAQVGPHAFALARKYVDKVITISEKDIGLGGEKPSTGTPPIPLAM